MKKIKYKVVVYDIEEDYIRAIYECHERSDAQAIQDAYNDFGVVVTIEKV